MTLSTTMVRLALAVHLALAPTAVLAASLCSSHPDLAGFDIQDAAFNAILGANASITLLQNATEPLFHEGAVYLASTDTLFVSSNRMPLPPGQVDASTSNQKITLSAVKGVSSAELLSVRVTPLDNYNISLPNGGWLGKRSSTIFWAARGSKSRMAGIYTIPDPINAPDQAFPLVTDFYGRPFNSPNDVTTNPADKIGSTTVWFTDPDYGVSQGFRDPPHLRNQVYRYDMTTNTTRVVADGFEKPNGLAFNADGSVLYVTDGSADPATNPQGAATIYAFDVHDGFLINKRLFAFAPVGIPDGIRVDASGNVWSATGSGVVVWNTAGTLLGQVRIKGGVASFGFGSTEKTIFLMGEKLLWRVQLG